jgi:hypothetical protein
LEEVPHEEEANTTDESVESDIRGKVVVFIGTIENHANDSDDEHDGSALFLSVTDVCDPVHQKQCW